MDSLLHDEFTYRRTLRRLVTRLEFQIFMLLIILVDAALVVIALIQDFDSQGFVYKLITWCVLVTCMLEVVARVLGFGLRTFCRDWMSVLDFIVILLAMLMMSEVVLVRFFKIAKDVRILLKAMWLARAFRVMGRVGSLS